ncbi:MAG TPA: ATP-binding protein [Herpetosiphonaceae bacterium]|nr:ATP-binding protein [Herpetosiphonaceae bacterium]
MTWLTILLGLALAAALWWGWRGRVALQHEVEYMLRRAQPAPEVEPFSPLFLTLSAAVEAGVIVISDTRLIRYCNQTAANLFGVPAADALNHGIITLVRDYQADTLIEQSIGQRDSQQVTLQPVLSNRTIRLWCEPLDGGGALIVARDLTQLSLLERARRDLVANVSHELRTPLASIKLLVETLDTQPPPELAKRMIGQVDSELDAVMHLVDELHELSQIESGRLVLQLQLTPVSEVVERAQARIQPQAARKGLGLISSVPAGLPLVYVDQDRMSQVLLNLLHNAVKWTDSGGVVSIEAAVQPSAALAKQLTGVADPAAQWLTLAVRDNGAGISPEALPRIFERFYKVDRARTRGVGGTGLGLAIVKHLVEGHGGVVWAASVEGSGSTFTVALPLPE